MNLNLPATTGGVGDAETGVGLSIPLGLGLGRGPQALSSRQTQVLRAVAAAAAMNDPGAALKTVKQAKDDPASVLDAKPDALIPVLAAVTSAMTDRAGAPTANEQHRVIARAAAVDPILVSAAEVALKANAQASSASLKWVASIDVNLLERVTRVAARERQFNLVPDTTSRLEGIDNKLIELEERLAKVEATVEAKPAAKK